NRLVDWISMVIGQELRSSGRVHPPTTTLIMYARSTILVSLAAIDEPALQLSTLMCFGRRRPVQRRLTQTVHRAHSSNSLKANQNRAMQARALDGIPVCGRSTLGA